MSSSTGTQDSANNIIRDKFHKLINIAMLEKVLTRGVIWSEVLVEIK